jgi:hypothetical protein
MIALLKSRHEPSELWAEAASVFEFVELLAVPGLFDKLAREMFFKINFSTQLLRLDMQSQYLPSEKALMESPFFTTIHRIEGDYCLGQIGIFYSDLSKKDKSHQQRSEKGTHLTKRLFTQAISQKTVTAKIN